MLSNRQLSVHGPELGCASSGYACFSKDKLLKLGAQKEVAMRYAAMVASDRACVPRGGLRGVPWRHGQIWLHSWLAGQQEPAGLESSTSPEIVFVYTCLSSDRQTPSSRRDLIEPSTHYRSPEMRTRVDYACEPPCISPGGSVMYMENQFMRTPSTSLIFFKTLIGSSDWLHYLTKITDRNVSYLCHLL